MKLETFILALLLVATVSACMASLPDAMNYEIKKSRAVAAGQWKQRSTWYEYQRFVEVNP